MPETLAGPSNTNLTYLQTHIHQTLHNTSHHHIYNTNHCTISCLAERELTAATPINPKQFTCNIRDKIIALTHRSNQLARKLLSRIGLSELSARRKKTTGSMGSLSLRAAFCPGKAGNLQVARALVGWACVAGASEWISWGYTLSIPDLEYNYINHQDEGQLRPLSHTPSLSRAPRGCCRSNGRYWTSALRIYPHGNYNRDSWLWYWLRL